MQDDDDGLGPTPSYSAPRSSPAPAAAHPSPAPAPLPAAPPHAFAMGAQPHLSNPVGWVPSPPPAAGDALTGKKRTRSPDPAGGRAGAPGSAVPAPSGANLMPARSRARLDPAAAAAEANGGGGRSPGVQQPVVHQLPLGWRTALAQNPGARVQGTLFAGVFASQPAQPQAFVMARRMESPPPAPALSPPPAPRAPAPAPPPAPAPLPVPAAPVQQQRAPSAVMEEGGSLESTGGDSGGEGSGSPTSSAASQARIAAALARYASRAPPGLSAEETVRMALALSRRRPYVSSSGVLISPSSGSGHGGTEGGVHHHAPPPAGAVAGYGHPAHAMTPAAPQHHGGYAPRVPYTAPAVMATFPRVGGWGGGAGAPAAPVPAPPAAPAIAAPFAGGGISVNNSYFFGFGGGGSGAGGAAGAPPPPPPADFMTGGAASYFSTAMVISNPAPAAAPGTPQLSFAAPPPAPPGFAPSPPSAGFGADEASYRRMLLAQAAEQRARGGQGPY